MANVGDKLCYQDLPLCGFKASFKLSRDLCFDHLYNNRCSRFKFSCSSSTGLWIWAQLTRQILKYRVWASSAHAFFGSRAHAQTHPPF